MYSRLSIFVARLSLAIATSPALANDDGFVVWDQNIASAVSADLADDSRCSASPYAIYSPSCHEQLNLSFDRPINYFTFLDRTALFLYKYHQLKYNQSLWSNAKLHSISTSRTSTSRRRAPGSSCAFASPARSVASAC